MRQAAYLILALPAILCAQDERCDSPAAPPAAALDVNPSSPLARTGISWAQGLSPVLRQKKPILFFQLLGNFSEGDC